jgi:hypothetical protein
MTMQQPATTRPARQRKPYVPSVSRASYRPHIQRLGHHGLFRVQSASAPNTYYIVDVIDGSCTCKHGEVATTRGQRSNCWHVKACSGLIFYRPAPKVEAAPVRPTGMAALDDAFGALNLPA